MNLEVKPVVMLALIAGLVWYIGRQPPRPARERVKRDDAPKTPISDHQPDGTADRVPRNGKRLETTRIW